MRPDKVIQFISQFICMVIGFALLHDIIGWRGVVGLCFLSSAHNLDKHWDEIK